jgi:hypothetical protein
LNFFTGSSAAFFDFERIIFLHSEMKLCDRDLCYSQFSPSRKPNFPAVELAAWKLDSIGRPVDGSIRKTSLLVAPQNEHLRYRIRDEPLVIVRAAR